MICFGIIILGLASLGTAKPINEERIQGGQPAELGMYPWHVSLTMITPYGNMFCGGSIINSTFIITAAHCVVDMMAFDVHEYLSVRVGAGQLYLNACSPNQQEIYADKVWVHPIFFPPQIKNDIALLRLSKPLVFGNHVRAVALPQANKEYLGNCQMVGWGIPIFDATQPNQLQHLRSPIVPNNICNRQFSMLGGALPTVTPIIQVCVNGIAGMGACKGDSGGSLTCNETFNGQSRTVIVGITSYGVPPCGTGFPDVFTGVAGYLPFTEATDESDDLITENHIDSIGGVFMAKKGDYPFHVLIQAMTDDGPNICGGVILNETHVLTAGSCLTDEEDPEHDFLPGLKVNVVGGFVSNEKCNSPRQRSWAKKVWLHKNFNDGGFDLAILKLETPFTFNSNVAAVRLPSAGTILNQNDCRLIGRGTELGDPVMSERLVWSSVKAFSQSVNSDCQNELAISGITLKPTQACNYVDDNSNDDCRGDIGGPLICNVQRTWVLGGLLSYRSSCMPGPYVYTEAASTLQFLSSSQFLGNSLDLSVAARNAKEAAIENDELPIRWLSHHMPSFSRPEKAGFSSK